MAESALKNNGGMTLVEVLVALAITFIIFLGLSDAGIVALNENIKVSLRDEAVSVAEEEMQKARRTLFANLYAAPDNVAVALPDVVRQLRGVNQTYHVSRTVNKLDTENIQVTTNIGWDRHQKSYSHQVVTIVRKR